MSVDPRLTHYLWRDSLAELTKEDGFFRVSADLGYAAAKVNFALTRQWIGMGAVAPTCNSGDLPGLQQLLERHDGGLDGLHRHGLGDGVLDALHGEGEQRLHFSPGILVARR